MNSALVFPKWLYGLLALAFLALRPVIPDQAQKIRNRASSAQTGEHAAADQRAVVSWGSMVAQDSLRPASAPSFEVLPFLMPPEGGGTDLYALPPSLDKPGFAPSALSLASPSPVASFLALEDNNTKIPPDTHGSPGLNHLMVMLNSQVRIQDRNGAVVTSTITLNSFWGAVNGGSGSFDPKVLYDPFHNRWIAVACDDANSTESGLLIGVSQTSDPTGMWNLYRVASADTNWIDYPNIGFNKNWIVVVTNVFSGSALQRRDIYAFNKSDLYTAGAGLYTRFAETSPLGSIWAPAVTYDNSLETNYLVQTYNSALGRLRMATITGNIGAEVFTTDLLSNFEVEYGSGWSASPLNSVDFAPQYRPPEQGAAQKIQVNDARIQNVIYRNDTLWATHTIFLPSGGSPTRSSVQWWQISPNSPPATPPSIVQKGRIDDPSGVTFYAFPSIAVNQNNDALIGFSSFSASQYASGAYAYRAAADPINTFRSVGILKAGEDYYYKTFSGTRNRWGDFSHTYVDPLNDSDFWTIQEYAWTDNSINDRWSTWWGKISPTPAAFDKSSPANGATDMLESLTLSWAASAGAVSYEFCYDETGDDLCDGSWTDVGGATSANLSGLLYGKTYYWQVRAINPGGFTEADDLAWWSFSTVQQPPAAFNKAAPANGAAPLMGVLTLSWSPSLGTVTYSYCLDAIDNDNCDSTWITTGTTTSADLSGLQNGEYYWQVRASNVLGDSDGDGGDWWSFTVASVNTFLPFLNKPGP